MAIEDVLRWVNGEGWLVLSGRNDILSEVRAMALSRANAEGGVAYIGLDDDDNEDLIEDMAELGAPTGYLVNIVAEDDETIRQRLEDASLIVIPDGYEPEIMYSSLTGVAIEAIRGAYKQGVVVLVEGEQISLFGKYFKLHDGTTKEGYDFVENSLLLANVVSLADSDVAIAMLESRLVTVALGIGIGSALVLGPNNIVETWGKRQVSIALGGSQI